MGLTSEFLREYLPEIKYPSKQDLASAAVRVLLTAGLFGASLGLTLVAEENEKQAKRPWIIAGIRDGVTPFAYGPLPEIDTEKRMFSGEYIRLAYESLKNKDDFGKSVLDYWAESGYKILEYQTYIPLETPEEMQVKKDANLKVLSNPFPENDANFDKNIIGEKNADDKLRVYVIVVLLDTNLEQIYLLGLTSPIFGSKSPRPSWINITTSDFDLNLAEGNVLYSAKFAKAMKDYFTHRSPEQRQNSA